MVLVKIATPIIKRKRNINFLKDVSLVLLKECEPIHAKVNMKGRSIRIIINNRISSVVIYKIESAEILSLIKDVVFNVDRVLSADNPRANI